MSKFQVSKFTAEEIALLKANRNTAKVTVSKITYTDEFYRKALEMYLCGYSASAILKIEGYDVELLGRGRVCTLTEKLRNMSRNVNAAEDKPDARTDDMTYERLKAENAVLRQELDFLKKVISVKTGKDSGQ